MFMQVLRSEIDLKFILQFEEKKKQYPNLHMDTMI